MAERDPHEHCSAWEPAGVEVAYAWHRFATAKTPTEQASAVVALSNAMSDLRSWLPGYDSEHDTMPWEREEDDDQEGSPMPDRPASESDAYSAHGPEVWALGREAYAHIGHMTSIGPHDLRHHLIHAHGVDVERTLWVDHVEMHALSHEVQVRSCALRDISTDYKESSDGSNDAYEPLFSRRFEMTENRRFVARRPAEQRSWCGCVDKSPPGPCVCHSLHGDAYALTEDPRVVAGRPRPDGVELPDYECCYRCITGRHEHGAGTTCECPACASPWW